MSKSSTASGSKATPLPTRSAWSKGPPSSSSTPRSQSPAPSTPTSATTPNATSHTRRPSALGPSVAVKDGVSIPKGNAASIRGSASPVTFGSIDDAQAPLSTSPATAPTLKLSEGVKSFGSVAAAAATGGPGHVNGKASVSSNSGVKPAAATTTPASTAAPSSSSVSTSTSASTSTSTPTSTSTTTTPSKPHNFDVRKMFQGSSSAPSQSPATPTYPSSTSSSPAVRNASLPPPASPHQPPSQLGQHSYPFVPGRPSNFGSGPGQPPRSPVHNRNMQNGAPRATPGPSSATPPVQPGMPSPRPSHPPQPGMVPPPGPPAVPMQGWYPNYYDPTAAYYGWYMPPPGSLPPQGMPHYPGPTPPSGMPLSPRNPQPQLHPAPQPPPPGTPTVPHAIPAPAPIPPAASPHLSSAPVSVTSPPSTPASTTTNITSPGSNASRLNTGASAFVPGGRKALVIKSPEGVEVDVKSFKPTKVEPAVVNASQNRRSIRLETEEARQKRLAEEQELERQAKEKEEAAKREKEKKEREEKEAEERRLKAEEDARKAKEEAERLERERLKKEEEEREAARRKAEEEEKERERLRLEEEARKAEEEKERLRKEEEEARRKEEEAAREAEKEKERLRLLEEEKAKAAAAEEEAKEAAAAAAAAAASEPEEGEVVEAPADLSASVSDKSKDLKDGLRIDTSSSPLDVPRRRPGPLDLSYTKNKTDVPAPLPSALATARIIEDLDSIKYPTGILSPSIDNTNAKNGKFRYDRDFLLQFMSICKEKPDMLPPLDAIGLEPADQTFNIARGGSGRHRQSSNAPLPPGMTRQNSGVGLGISGSGFGGKGNQFSMGNFGAPTGAKLTSDDRFQMSNRGASISGSPASFNRALPMTRTTSQGGSGSGRTRSKRGTQREPHKPSHAQHSSAAFPSTQSPAVGANNLPLEPVAPLQVSENRWVASSISKKPSADTESPEVVDKKVKALLNKLTMEKFDSLSDQIIDWANKSEKEKNGQTLIQVIRLVFEKATDEAAWSEMYARLCRKMMEQISPRVQDEGIQNAEGKPIAGGQLFRKYLLNRCQEDFERGWSVREAAAAAAASKQGQDEAAQKEATASGESALYSEEYYAAQKAKRQGLGLVKFIGELFKLSMLTERIMHECIKKLLGNVENPEEDDIESLCKLLTTVGPQLDTPKARNHMDIYFSRIRDMTKPGAKVSSRMQFMLLDVLELRERKWIARNLIAAPTTIAQVHEAAAKEKAASSEALQRNTTMSRTSSRRGHDRGESSQVDPNGWTTAGSGPARPSRVGDLSNFGKISKPNAMTFGPSSIFAGGKKGDAKSGTQSLSRQSSINMFSALTQHADSAEPEAAKPAESQQRRKLNLLPRTKALDDKPPATTSEPPSEEEETAVPTSMSEADAKKKIEEDAKEFFAIRNLEEAEVYFTALPAEHHFRLIDKLVTVAVERKIDDAQLVADLFKHITSKNLCSELALEEGLTPTVEILSDIAIDVPKAFDLMAIMIKGTPLVSDEEKKTKLVSKCMDDSDKLLALLS